MGKPKRALLISQLERLTEGKVDGSHDICKVKFIEDGITKVAFYKKLEPTNHYPELLAKMSVAASVFKRLFQGKNTAEERLVYDKDDGRIVGTLSITIDGFKPLNYAGEGIPTDPVVKEQVVPSTDTLIEKNAMETLFSRWFLDDDDTHPHNIGFAQDRMVDIDFDMCWYWFTVHMKGPRPLIGIPKTRVNLTTSDWENFPHTIESMHYHGATYSRPGQFSLTTGIPGEELVLDQVLIKYYAAPTEFLSLASSPLAREQLFSAALKALLTFNPAMVKQRLHEYFGSMAFNYTSLNESDSSLCATYEREFPDYCNSKTNAEPFVDFIMNLYQAHYDNLYRVVVFYMGCAENNYQLPLNPTYFELYKKPSFYKNICLWMRQQNQSLATDAPELHFDLAAVERRYHQIWRDAFAPKLRDLLHGMYNLTQKLLKDSSSYAASKLCFKQASDSSVTDVWDLFGLIPEFAADKIADKINLDPNSEYRIALNLLVEFTNKFRDITKKYYEKNPKELVATDNTAFVDGLFALHKEYDLNIRRALSNTTTAANEFSIIATDIKEFTDLAGFEVHLITTDEQMHASPKGIINKDLLPATDTNVVDQYVKSLFAWAKGLKPADLEYYILDIVTNKYEKLLSTRNRGPLVKAYLKQSTNETGDNRLAYIFSSGSRDDGELNLLLIEHLTPKMLEAYPIMTIRNAVTDGSFNKNKLVYNRAVVKAAREETRLTHLYSKEGIKSFYSALYQWVETLPEKEFKQIKEAALKEYQNGKSTVGWLLGVKSRVNEVLEYKNYPQAKQVALIFLNGEKDSTLSLILFDKIIEKIKKEPNALQKATDVGYRLIMQFNPKIHEHIITDACMKENATAPSHQQPPLLSSSSFIQIRNLKVQEATTSYSM